jgi:hypothetical protein
MPPIRATLAVFLEHRAESYSFNTVFMFAPNFHTDLSVCTRTHDPRYADIKQGAPSKTAPWSRGGDGAYLWESTADHEYIGRQLLLNGVGLMSFWLHDEVRVGHRRRSANKRTGMFTPPGLADIATLSER